jgi:glycine cleavage system H protein
MSDLLNNLKYAKSHEWSLVEDNRIIRVGITEFAQEQLGDLVYVDLPKVGRKVEAGEQCAVVESVKTASDLFSPVTGEIVAINEILLDQPEKINDDPYKVWIFCVKADALTELDLLMDAAAYQQMIEQ